MRGVLANLGVWLLGTALAIGFWLPLVRGAGLIGGDTYNYFLPLKTWYGDGLQRNELRFWHPHIGNGVPTLGESQTGMLYPPYLAAYRWLDTIPAYNAVLIGHYAFAFAATVWLGGIAGLNRPARLLAATVFVYGWFPVRACLDWAIVTGSWLPVELGCTLLWLRSGRSRWGWALAASLAVQLFAGHFQLAWTALLGIALATLLEPAPWRRKLGTLGYLALGLAFAAPQLLSTWELKAKSVRNAAAFAGETRYGRLPPAYLQQLWRGWDSFAEAGFYARVDEHLANAGGDSNRIEAHLYFGIVPLALAAAGALVPAVWRSSWRWLLLAAVGMALATGAFSAWLQHVPGFGYFRYPGRYSLLAAVFGSLWIGAAWSALPKRAGHWLLALPLAWSLVEFRWIADRVCYAQPQTPPILDRRGASEVARRLAPRDRVLAPDGNTLALLNAGCVPPYIGLTPALYLELWSAVPDVFKGQPAATPDLLARLRRAGVTKILTEKPLPQGWPATLEWSGHDAFLHPRWGRDPQEPLHLYRFEAGAGRVWLDPPGNEPPVLSVFADRFEVQLPKFHDGGTLHTTEWALPGWSCTINFDRVPLLKGDFLAVRIPEKTQLVVFQYTPTAAWIGAKLALAALLAGVFWEAFRKRGPP